MSDLEPPEFNELQMVLIPVLVEAVLVTMFIGFSILLVAIMASTPVPV